jgi:tetratricopeptide (TPR) repeat protein
LFLRRRGPLAGIVLVLLVLSGCGDDEGVTEPPVVSLLASGWQRFAAADYAGAIEKFEEAVESDRSLGDGHNGIGWCYLRLDSLDLALDAFQTSIAKGLVGADAQAGRCLVLNRLDEYRQAIFAGEAVVSINPLFKLAADPTVDVRDVRLAMAQSHLALGEYVEALDQATAIDSSILINPNSATFVSELIAAIENLTAILSIY